MTKQLTFAVPGSLETPTGGYAYDRRVIAELRALGWRVDVCDIGNGFPSPSPAQLENAQTMLANTPPAAAMVIDGLAYGVMAECAARLTRTHRLIALVHHPLALETGLTSGEAAALHKSESAALALARHVIATSSQTAQILMSNYNVAREKITVATPGNDAMVFVEGNANGPCHLLSVGSIVPRKGYDVLMAALATLTDLSWRLTIAGDDTRSAQTVSALKTLVADAGLGDRVTIAGALSEAELAKMFRCADVFVSASHFEGYGMAATTAIACGLPIVATRVGALGETAGNAGILVPPNDSVALADALRRVIADPDVRRQLGHASRAAARNLPTWRDAAERIAAAIERVA